MTEYFVSFYRPIWPECINLQSVRVGLNRERKPCFTAISDKCGVHRFDGEGRTDYFYSERKGKDRFLDLSRTYSRPSCVPDSSVKIVDRNLLGCWACSCKCMTDPCPELTKEIFCRAPIGELTEDEVTAFKKLTSIESIKDKDYFTFASSIELNVGSVAEKVIHQRLIDKFRLNVVDVVNAGNYHSLPENGRFMLQCVSVANEIRSHGVQPSEVAKQLEVPDIVKAEPKKVVKKTASVNARLADLFMNKPETMDCSAETLAGMLKCGKTSIVNSETWKKRQEQKKGENNDRASKYRDNDDK